MIALTQEKREELIKYYGILIDWHNDRLSSYLSDFDRGAIESSKLMTEIALASLTAEPVLYAVDSDVEDKIYTALCNEHEVGAYPLFTAPPVPEIKLPEKFSEEVDDNFDYGKELGWNECLAEIKLLNGLGE